MKEALDSGPSVGLRERQIAQHQGLVRSVVTTVWRSVGESIPLDDLLAYGQIGLIEAVDRYRPDSGCEFTTFAYYRIRGAALDGLCKIRGMSRRLADKARFLRGFQDLHAERTQDGALASEGREAVIGAIDDSLRDGLVLFLLTNGVEAGEDDEAESVESQVSAKEWGVIVQRAIATLPEAESGLVRRMYFEGLSLTEAAEALDLSRSWACRLHQRAIAALRQAIDRITNPPPRADVIR